ncbi:MAG: HEAT repeat domain-containing protein [Saprospiraceae bacterium]
MGYIENLEKRWSELLANTSKTKSAQELQAYTAEVFALSKEIELERAKEYQGLIYELADIGIIVNSIWDLVNTKTKYPEAIPILMKYLPLVNYIRNKEGIVRALSVKEAKGLILPLMIKEYMLLTKDKENLRWLIGNAVNATITKEEVELIFPIVLNKGNGLSRQMFVAALGKINTEKVREILKQLLNDDDKVISEEAQKALKKLGEKNLPKNT